MFSIIVSFCSFITLIPPLQKTVTLLTTLASLEKTSVPLKLVTSTPIVLTRQVAENLQEMLAFWLLISFWWYFSTWKIISILMQILPFSGFFGLYIQIWLFWPIIPVNNLTDEHFSGKYGNIYNYHQPNAKISGTRMILNHLDKFVNIFNKFKNDSIDWCLNWQQNYYLNILIKITGINIWKFLESYKKESVGIELSGCIDLMSQFGNWVGSKRVHSGSSTTTTTTTTTTTGRNRSKSDSKSKGKSMTMSTSEREGLLSSIGFWKSDASKHGDDKVVKHASSIETLNSDKEFNISATATNTGLFESLLTPFGFFSTSSTSTLKIREQSSFDDFDFVTEKDFNGSVNQQDS
ncbi:hypothetical protein DAMA08_003730 [Martiniozyma asiatica (nom. inval.)]|nr:hypothetical protein DAMA08_003730 [Martiniozyma asiatica]